MQQLNYPRKILSLKSPSNQTKTTIMCNSSKHDRRKTNHILKPIIFRAKTNHTGIK